MRRLDFVSFQVTDLEVSKRFYTDKLGFEISEMSNAEAVIFKFKKKNQEAGFAIRKSVNKLSEKPLGKGISTWFAVDEDIEQLYDKLTQNNVSILGDIVQTPFGQAFHVSDPDGYQLTFIALK